MPKVRETAYNTLVRPQLEYASTVLDPHTKVRISQIEHVQGRAVRWTVSNFDSHASATRIIPDLGQRTLEQRLASLSILQSYTSVCLHVISWIIGWNVTKFASLYKSDRTNSLLDFGDLDLIFKVTVFKVTAL